MKLLSQYAEFLRSETRKIFEISDQLFSDKLEELSINFFKHLFPVCRSRSEIFHVGLKNVIKIDQFFPPQWTSWINNLEQLLYEDESNVLLIMNGYFFIKLQNLPKNEFYERFEQENTFYLQNVKRIYKLTEKNLIIFLLFLKTVSVIFKIFYKYVNKIHAVNWKSTFLIFYYKNIENSGPEQIKEANKCFFFLYLIIPSIM